MPSAKPPAMLLDFCCSTASGFALSGGDSGNYAISQPTGITADILANASATSIPDTVLRVSQSSPVVATSTSLNGVSVNTVGFSYTPRITMRNPLATGSALITPAAATTSVPNTLAGSADVSGIISGAPTANVDSSDNRKNK